MPVVLSVPSSKIANLIAPLILDPAADVVTSEIIKLFNPTVTSMAQYLQVQRKSDKTHRPPYRELSHPNFCELQLKFHLGSLEF